MGLLLREQAFVWPGSQSQLTLMDCVCYSDGWPSWTLFHLDTLQLNQSDRHVFGHISCPDQSRRTAGAGFEC